MESKSSEKEMNRGFLQLIVLILLEKPSYGYLMVKDLAKFEYHIEESTLYPLLRRLESKNFIESTWKVDSVKPKKYYVITEEGKQTRRQLMEMFGKQKEILQKVLKGDEYV
ncbi:PadR family transcriptional regulator [Viridibacillus sp. YIM B01967]|uniref:PadR family transcriptional regulator n=1 Tax=Viridibacillus soli TaxID=2798301 RepID=A0ABS1HDZ6_9BACL|nr:PadR family transcriptional regulator [Viridibacillus soli]MBK3497208.1 PadR family transcriptional regulator [Viridibacillus soli]